MDSADRNDARDVADLAQLLRGFATMPELLRLVQAQTNEIAALRTEISGLRSSSADSTDGWLDAKAAAKYLGISASSFDKYRYKSMPKIKGYALDGKVLYKKGDLDNFVRLYAIKSGELT
jgi:hypothetical protein